MLRIRFVEEDEIGEVADLATMIWHEYFPCILSDDQIDYMVDQYQSEKAMRKQVREKGYGYAFIEQDGEIIGYTGLCPEGDRLFISKFYLIKSFRGKGLGTEALKMLFDYAKKGGFKSIYLTVNKHNEKAIKAYVRNGFVSTQGQKTDIGNGFFMDDYVMEKVL